GAEVDGDRLLHLGGALGLGEGVLRIREPAGRRAHQAERAHALAEPPRQLEHEESPHRPTDERDAGHAERAHQMLQVRRHGADRVAGARVRRLAVATHVDRDHRVPVTQRDHLALPEGAVAGPAVDEEHRRAAARAVVAERDAGMGEEGHVALVARVRSGPQGAITTRGARRALPAFPGADPSSDPVRVCSYRLDGVSRRAYAPKGPTVSGLGFLPRSGADRAENIMMNEAVDWREWMRGLGRQLRRVREFLGLSQDQVARLAGVSQGAVSRLEAGRGLATPMMVVLKVHRVLTRALHAFDPAIPDDEVRATLGLENLIAPPIAGGSDEPLPITRDADLEMLVQLYRTLPERQRRTLVAVVRATASSLGEATPAPAELSHTGS